jgi:hypothetical protein
LTGNASRGDRASSAMRPDAPPTEILVEVWVELLCRCNQGTDGDQ